jgi:hypothetical protein
MISAILIYVISVILNWKWVNIAYSKDGVRYKNTYELHLIEEPVLTLIPVINTISAVRWLLEWPWPTRQLALNLYQVKKFFRIKDL